MRYFVKLAFHGTPFLGWQIQAQESTIQGVMEHAFLLHLKEPVEVTGCGRTDTGVHAKCFYAHFDTSQELSKEELTQLIHKLNSFLPNEIVIYDIFPVTNDLHARFSAESRTYRYYVSTAKNPFNFAFSYRVYEKLNLPLMNEAAQRLLETDDFTSFSKLHTQVNNNRCHVTEAFWKNEDEVYVFQITANRFLRNMVRAIVGTLLLVGKEKITIADFQSIIDAKDRSQAGISVPAHALFLENVRYPAIQ